MSFCSRSSSPPPPMPSPQLVPTSLPSPPPLSTKSSRSCLSLSPRVPIPNRQSGSHTHVRRTLFGYDDDFGTRTRNAPHPHRPSRCRSPPPSPPTASAVPPVPPIPSYVLSPADTRFLLAEKRPIEQRRTVDACSRGEDPSGARPRKDCKSAARTWMHNVGRGCEV